jgi:predicted permease
MHALIAAQVAFCFLVLFVAGLFAVTFDRLLNQPTGFSANRILTLDTVAQRAQPTVFWEQVAEHLRTVPGVETVALAVRPLLSGYSSNDAVAVNGGPPSEDMAYFLSISPGWVEAMKIPFINGRDFRATDTYPGVAIVNETFAKRYFPFTNPVGRTFERATDEGPRLRLQIVGLVRDAPYRSIREPFLPLAYVPFQSIDAKGALRPVRSGTFIVRTSSSNPLALASILRQEIPRARPEFRVSNIRTQVELVRAQTVRERLLAMLALFFAVVALLLSGVGLYGVLDYTVLQRRREIGIRMAIGAQPGDIARRVTAGVFGTVLLGTLLGLALGLASVRYIEALLYGVKPTGLGMLALAAATILAAALVAALPAVIRAVRTDPVSMLRAE